MFTNTFKLPVARIPTQGCYLKTLSNSQTTVVKFAGITMHHGSTDSESRQMVKVFFFFSTSTSSGWLAQICLTLSRRFSHKTAPFFTEQCTGPSTFK